MQGRITQPCRPCQERFLTPFFLRQPSRVFELEHQVKVIGHQTVMVQPQAEAIPITGQQAEEVLSVCRVGKDRLAIVAAVHDMVASFLRPLLSPRYAWHRRSPRTPAGPVTARDRFYIQPTSRQGVA